MKEQHYKIKTGTKIEPLDAQRLAGDSLVPRLPFSMMISGGKGQGKSTLLLNLLLSQDLLAGKFNKILFFSPTASLDAKMKRLSGTDDLTVINKPLQKAFKKLKRSKKIMDTTDMEMEPETSTSNIEFYDEVDLDALKSLVEYQKVIIEVFGKGIADNVLCVYDDLASSKIWKNIEFVKAIFNSRHVKLSVIITTQSYHSISKPIRLNNSMLVMFETSNSKEIFLIYEENKCKYSFKQFEEICRKVYDTPFQIIVFNHQNSDRNKRLQIGFNNFVSDIYKDGAIDFERARATSTRPLLY